MLDGIRDDAAGEATIHGDCRLDLCIIFNFIGQIVLLGEVEKVYHGF